jgi:protein-S-isoprenylcysteine O-methyltransferase Ste14
MTRFERALVWLGAAAFVASLAACVLAYGVAWSDVGAFDPRRGARAVAIDAALFAAFAAHHSLFARDAVKRWLARRLPDRLLRPMYVWLASVLLLAVIALWQEIGGQVYRHDGWQAVAHTVVQLAGVWLIMRSVRLIDALELAGVRQNPGTSLQIRGPYHLVRHPVYLGWMLVVWGAANMTGDRLGFAAITSLYLVMAIPWEERSLERVFGAQYTRYRARVRWRVLPYVY